MSEKKNSKFVQKLLDLSKRAAQEVHLRAIRDAFLFTIPFLVLSGFMVFTAWYYSLMVHGVQLTYLKV